MFDKGGRIVYTHTLEINMIYGFGRLQCPPTVVYWNVIFEKGGLFVVFGRVGSTIIV